MAQIKENFFSGNDTNLRVFVDTESTETEIPPDPDPQFAPWQPHNDLVQIRQVVIDNTKHRTAGLDLQIPEKFRQKSNLGIVVSVSPKVHGIQAGDRVTFGLFNAEMQIMNGEEFLLVRENDIRGVEKAL